MLHLLYSVIRDFLKAKRLSATQLEGAEVLDALVAVDGNIITARGAGAAIEFALKLVECAVSKEESDRQRKAILCD